MCAPKFGSLRIHPYHQQPTIHSLRGITVPNLDALAQQVWSYEGGRKFDPSPVRRFPSGRSPKSNHLVLGGKSLSAEV